VLGRAVWLPSEIHSIPFILQMVLTQQNTPGTDKNRYDFSGYCRL